MCPNIDNLVVAFTVGNDTVGVLIAYLLDFAQSLVYEVRLGIQGITTSSIEIVIPAIVA